MTSKIVPPPPLPKKRANNKLETILSPLNLNLCIKINYLYTICFYRWGITIFINWFRWENCYFFIFIFIRMSKFSISYPYIKFSTWFINFLLQWWSSHITLTLSSVDASNKVHYGWYILVSTLKLANLMYYWLYRTRKR